MSFRAPVAVLLAVLSGCQCATPDTRAVRPEISVQPASVDFGDTAPGVSVERTVTVLNTTEARLTLSDVMLEGTDASSFLLGSLSSLQVEAGSQLAVRVVYAPTAVGAHSARLGLRSDATNSPELLVPLVGTAHAVDACLGITCSTPPAATCESATTLRTYGTSGTCVMGVCNYTSTATTCASSCTNGACAGLPPWAQDAYVKASNTGAPVEDRFGDAVAISSDGSTLAIAAPNEASHATGVNGDQADNSAMNSGAVYVFRRTGTAWVQEAYVKASNTGDGDRFGHAIALSGDGNTLAVGAYVEASNATGVNGNQADNSASYTGAAYVFRRSSGAWAQEAYVKPSNMGGFFGWAIALSSDGDTLAVGAYGEKSNATGVNGDQADRSVLHAGAVYVFRRSGAAWAQEAYVKASNTGANDWFGEAVTLSSDGNTLAVGAPYEQSSATGLNGNQADDSARNAGAVYVFRRIGTAWAQEAYVKASNTAVGDAFGIAVALSGDGSTLAVGAHKESSHATGINGDQSDNSATEAGAVYVFRRSGTSWAQEAYVKASNTGTGDWFGWAVALSDDGSRLVVGARNEDSNATGIDGDQSNDLAAQSGAVYVFQRAATSWAQEAYLKPSNTDIDDDFGTSVALSGDASTVLVGANLEDSNATGIDGDQADNSALNAGAAYVFRR